MQEMLRQLHCIGELQRHLLPRHLPQRDGWQIAVHYQVGKWPGGDYYDFIPLPDGRLSLLIADASDQGAPSTALIAMMRVVLHACPLSTGEEKLPFCPVRHPVLQPPHILFGHLNKVLAENSLEEQYVTAFCGVLDPIDGSFYYSNAGHPLPRHWNAAAGCVEPVSGASGLALGMEASSSYHRKWAELAPGDLLVLYSDGLTAAINADGQSFGTERLDKALKAVADQGAEQVKEHILAELDAFLDDQDPVDDVTLLVVERER